MLGILAVYPLLDGLLFRISLSFYFFLGCKEEIKLPVNEVGMAGEERDGGWVMLSEDH